MEGDVCVCWRETKKVERKERWKRSDGTKFFILFVGKMRMEAEFRQ